jgi:hypothetical protein
MYVICVLCLTVVRLPPSINPFAVKIIIIIRRRNTAVKVLKYEANLILERRRKTSKTSIRIADIRA